MTTPTPFNWTPGWLAAMEASIATWRLRARIRTKQQVSCESCALCRYSAEKEPSEEIVFLDVNCHICPIGALGYHGCENTPVFPYHYANRNNFEIFQVYARDEVNFLIAVRNGTASPNQVDDEE